MAHSLEQITANALALSREERTQLVDRLLESIDAEDAPLSEAWAAEPKRRKLAVADGAETFAAEDVFAEIRRE